MTRSIIHLASEELQMFTMTILPFSRYSLQWSDLLISDLQDHYCRLQVSFLLGREEDDGRQDGYGAFFPALLLAWNCLEEQGLEITGTTCSVKRREQLGSCSSKSYLNDFPLH